MLQIARERINAGPRVKMGIPVDVTVIIGTVITGHDVAGTLASIITEQNTWNPRVN